MFMGNGSIIALSLLHGGAHAIIFIYLFFPAERAYTPVIFGRAFCRIMQSREWSASQQ